MVRTDEHRYFDETGAEYASVSSLLQQEGLVDTRWYKPHHAQRGTDRHNAVHLVINGLLPVGALPPDIQPYAEAAEKFQAEFCREVLHTEDIVCSPKVKIAGTIDLVARSYDGDIIIADWKTGSLTPWHGVQMAAYEYLYREHHNAYDEKIRTRIVCLHDDGTYHVHAKSKNRTFGEAFFTSTWQAIVQLHYARSVL